MWSHLVYSIWNPSFAKFSVNSVALFNAQLKYLYLGEISLERFLSEESADTLSLVDEPLFY